ncbi:MAG: DUF4198 domain-containing protein [Paludisphaera borealis]|uniref:DUF4198 domain-containing protein n=1 Tax=Paludisphaera borealis TaxID=1387353 RepID=UPI00283E5704|nr:DUF4198 domain-containing protein [Paludisphaera borealis]MDR3618350.1 DUF4198 domain-containing protein [Paludisphaera borealis]
MLKKSVAMGWLALVVASTTTFGHDYWLAPNATSTVIGGVIDVRLYRGEPLDVGDERPLEVDPTERFRLLARGLDLDLLKSAEEGRTPVARLTLTTPGGNLVVMERRPQPNRLAADKFTEYLKEEGLDAIIDQRKQLGESEADGRELYGRCLKALVQVGDRHNDAYGRVVGHVLEILPEVDPTLRRLGEPLPVRVLFEGRPLAKAQITSHVQDAGDVHNQTVTTDAEGRATFRIDRKGLWLIRMVHMRRAPKLDDADWESFWAAYTFGL